MSRPIERAADWLSVAEAGRRILAAVAPLPAERIPLGAGGAGGRVLAEPVVAPVHLPPWDNSAMDGYAVHAADVRGASADAPVRLPVVERVGAGAFPTRPLERGQAIQIMTGAPVPAGADSVVRLEHTTEEADHVLVRDGGDAGRNIRRAGEDVTAGATVLEAGRVLRAGEVAILASLGVAEPAVHRRPRVAVLATGDELVDVGDFEAVRAGRRIVNSNSYALAAALHATGCEPLLLGIARDDTADLVARIREGLSADALITTAGASVGEHDLVKEALEALGFELDFWRVRMRPGSPFSFGGLPADGRRVPVFGLPGNPVSALVTFEVLVRPALRRMLGRSAVFGPTVRVRAAEPIPSRAGLVHFLRATLRAEGDGWAARLTGPQGSGIMTSMAQADALLVIPEESNGLEVGEIASALLLHGPDHAVAEPPA